MFHKFKCFKILEIKIKTALQKAFMRQHLFFSEAGALGFPPGA
jgi:hypothetical protein